MTQEEVKSNLCFYDPRNPEAVLESDDLETPANPICGCDNCFYDRTKLAEEILMLKAELSAIQQSLKNIYLNIK